MSILKVYLGTRGDTGLSGEDGTGVSDIRGSIVDNPIFSALDNNNISNVGDIEWDRDGEALIRDRYGDYQWVNGDDATNYVNYSNDYTQWADVSGRWSVASTGNLDPLGGSTATELVLDSTTTSTADVIGLALGGTSDTGTFTVSFWAKSTNGVISDLRIDTTGGFALLGSAITTDYVRYSFTLLGVASDQTLIISPYGLIGAKLIIFGVQFESGSSATTYIPTTGSPVTLINPINPWRANENGYLIEDQKTNKIKNSENLQGSNWSITDGIVSAYTGLDPFGDANKLIQLTFDTSTDIVLGSTGVFAAGVEFSVSFDLLISGGSVSSITAALSDGGQVAVIGELPTEDFKKVVLKVTAGGSSG